MHKHCPATKFVAHAKLVQLPHFVKTCIFKLTRVPPDAVTVVRDRVAVAGVSRLDSSVRSRIIECRSAAGAVEASVPDRGVEVAAVQKRGRDHTSVGSNGDIL